MLEHAVRSILKGFQLNTLTLWVATNALQFQIKPEIETIKNLSKRNYYRLKIV